MNNSCIFKKVVMMFLLLVGTLNVYSQHVVTGKVIDEQGPLIGASVTVKDAAVPTGTVTDAEGKYSIKVPNSKTILVYSYIGYVDKAEAVGKRTVVNVTLEEDSKMLDDVVVIGYGTQAKSHLTGSISKLEGEKLINVPVSDVTTALQGAMTGLTVSNETSEVGVTPSIRVRGTGSISADSEPLVIIDGFPVSGGLSSINAADVKSIEILKDAASAAIYGSRAANGVIMVTTKSGTPDKPKYSFKFYQGFKYAYQLHDMMTSSEWLGLLEEEAALGGPKVPSAARGAAYLESQMGTTDWQKEGLRDMAGITNVQMSVSGGRKETEEKFMKGIKAISNLKLRASYGVTGNNRISYNAALEVLNSANYVTGKGTGSLVNGSANISSSLANSNITWEQTDEFNYGLDLGLFNNRINLAIDAYYSVTRALLFEQPTQSFTGYTHYWNNIGKVRNSGLEIQLDTHNMKSRKFSWDTNINFSLSRNKLLELGGEQQMISLGERNEGYLAKVGEPLIQFYGYKTCGVWNSAEEIAANPHFSDDAPGGIRIVDTNNDGSLTPEDRVALGTPYPDFTWGITNTFQIKDFDISFLIQGVQGITVLNGDVYYNETKKWNKKYTKNRWVSAEHPGDGKTPYQNVKTGHDLMLTDYPLQNASYACLRNFTVGYTLPATAARKIKLSGVRFYVSGSNLLYIWGSGYKGINPESRMTSGNYSSAMISGYQRGGFPLTSTISAGFDINF